ncbi:MAG: hypothetical protein IJR45_05285, partial [Firmicutes bacterium]|nr:hypothetical protein [Bacillota bacterium]
KGEFWIESKGKAFELHLSASLNDIFSADREKILSISSSGKNSAAKGIMGKVRSVFETMLIDYVVAYNETYDTYYTMGMITDAPPYYSAAWSLIQYKEAEKSEDEWDELEKSIIANLADDVVVGFKGKQVDIIVKKDFN